MGRRILVWGFGAVPRLRWPGGESAGWDAGDGRWAGFVETGEARTDFWMEVVGGERIEDVAVGELWMVAGQSNAEWRMRWCEGGRPGWDLERALAEGDDADLRLFEVPQRWAGERQEECMGRWVRAQEGCAEWSALAYWLGRERRGRAGVPVGVVVAAYGGTEIERWLPEAVMREEFGAEIAEAEALMGRTVDWGHLGEGEARELAGGLGFRNALLWTVDGVGRYLGDVMCAAGAGTLDLGWVDDVARVWVNGAFVGESAGWRERARFAVEWRAGRNEVRVEVMDRGGEGGLQPYGEVVANHPGGASVVENWRLQFCGERTFERGLGRRWGTLWNGMMAPLAGLSLDGFVWYQGEANVVRAGQYERLLGRFLKVIEEEFEIEGVKAVVQIAPYGYGSGLSPRLMDEQRRVAERLGWELVPTCDLAKDETLHPADKFGVAKRVGLHRMVEMQFQGDGVEFGEGVTVLEGDWEVFREGEWHAVTVRAEGTRVTWEGVAEGVRGGWRDGCGAVVRLDADGWPVAGFCLGARVDLGEGETW